ncbi:MAG: pyrimidine-nucleoside phosphorylase [Pseudobutyrivibrio sp.]|nr:pyrimidine-nucleoside phosphorylase [Pseudobutyrivibrio sp.]
MRMYDVIDKKKNGGELSTEEINELIQEYTKGNIPEYQMSALLMAICFVGMNERERFDLTMAMRDSGEILDLSAINGIKVDKHSTGGVGDKVTLVLAPVLAALGIPVAKMSGRGLGHTGGTIDKLEAFTGFNTELNEDEFINQVNDIGIAVTGQSKNLTPADKKLYALRDLTATVNEISLITSSIMSKKLASGSDVIVLDVTVGHGAFMKSKEDAVKLANSMVTIGKMAGKKISAVLTNMNEPLGKAVGNNLEVIEAINALKGEGPADLMEVVNALAVQILKLSNIETDEIKALNLIQQVITEGKALNKLEEMVKAQKGDASFINDITKFKKASIIKEIVSPCDGYINDIDAQSIGLASMSLGGGREDLDDVIDMSVGVIMEKKVGDIVKANDVLAVIHANDEAKLKKASEMVLNAYSFSDKPIECWPMILDVIE